MGSFTEETNQDDKELIKVQIEANKKNYYLVLLVLGLFNNFGYVLINSSAQQLAQNFHKESFMPFFTTSLTFLGIVTSFVNSSFLLKIAHMNKIRAMVSLCAFAYLCVGVSNLITSEFGFFLALFGSVVMGISGTLGEQTILGFLKGFAPELISGWGSGTGFAGVFGAGANFLLRYLEVPGYLIFLGMIPTTLIYLGCFTWLHNQKVLMIQAQESQESGFAQDGEYQGMPNSRGELADSDKDKKEAEINQVLSMQLFKRLWPSISFLAANLGLVYFLEYTIITGFADKATDEDVKSDDPLRKNAFILLNLCYQIGVVISRSSLPVIKIKKVWIVTALQFANFFVWAWIAYTKAFGLPLEFTIMIWVGLMGGASYVNVLYQVLESNTIEKKDKEVSINIISICNNIGVLGATFASYVLEVTIYKNK